MGISNHIRLYPKVYVNQKVVNGGYKTGPIH